MRRVVAILLGLSPFFIAPTPASAHSFGKLYNLPVPFWMYLYGGAAAILVSFLIIGYFINKTHASSTYPTLNLSRYTIFSFLTKKWFITFLKITSVFFFFLIIIAGLFGTDMPSFNFAMTFFWIIFVLLFAYLTAIFGNIFAIINPIKVLIEWFENLTDMKAKGMMKYPKQLSYYPALVFYFLFIWIELMGNTTPIKLSLILLQYSMLTIMGVTLFGKNIWFQYGEFFSVFFRLLGKMAIIEYVPAQRKNQSAKLFLRPPFIGLLKGKAENFSLLLFILFMLSSTAFDGFRSTTPFYRLYWQNLDDVVRPILGENSYDTFQTLGLLLSPFVFLLIYLALVGLAKVITKSKLSLIDLSLQFAFSLVPIAFVYNIAHYYTLIITEGENMIRLISDPFGMQWNLFGTVNWYSGIQAVDTGFVWHSQVALILLGHIVGVYLAHLVSLKVFPSHKQALLSQFPMLLLMVSFTMTGLWILSQPITSGL